MSRHSLAIRSGAFVLCLILGNAQHRLIAQDAKNPQNSENRPDSFKYYGPQGLWYKFKDSEALRLGRDTWFFWTGGSGLGGTQYFYRALSVNSGSIPLQGKIQFYSLMQMSHQDRWEKVGLINEPNCVEAKEPNEYGLKLDVWKGDPEDYYPHPRYQAYYAETNRDYGEPTGIIGLRKFPNPKFDASKWDPDRYYENPAKVEPPHVVGITCAFCHVAFNPLNPPRDPANPRWENLAANIGNQYLHEGRLFFGDGRLFSFHGDRGLSDKDFVWQYGETQQRGTSETSRFSYDFINNPNTINAVFYVGNRVSFMETTPHKIPQKTLHVLKDGADSVGLEMGLGRVFINIGMEGQYWIDHLWNPVGGQRQRPFLLDEVRGTVSADRQAELIQSYGPDFGKSWRNTEARIPALISYLTQYGPMHLKDAPGGQKYLLNEQDAPQAARLRRGKLAFADHCARCHSNKRPYYLIRTPDDEREFYRASVLADDFLVGNTLSSDERHPVTEVQTNIQRAVAKNAIEGDIWADLSSREYKALAPVGIMKFPVPPTGPNPGPPRLVEFQVPAGGRGYYRPASLVSLWATAPYLHNNSVGPLTSDPSKPIPDPSVEERMKLFDLGIREMLWPLKRVPSVKRTTAVCSILPRDVFHRVVVNSLNQTLTVDLGRIAQEAVAAGILTPDEAKRIGAVAPAELEKIIEKKLEGATALADGLVRTLAEQKGLIAEGIRQQIGKLLLDGKVITNPKTLENLQRVLEAKLPVIVDRALADLQKLTQLEFTLPAGFPVNLILNLDIDKLPYVVTLFFKYRTEPDQLAEELMRLSECPDLIENHGHPFGSGLSDSEKEDLIDFLKTF